MGAKTSLDFPGDSTFMFPPCHHTISYIVRNLYYRFWRAYYTCSHAVQRKKIRRVRERAHSNHGSPLITSILTHQMPHQTSRMSGKLVCCWGVLHLATVVARFNMHREKDKSQRICGGTVASTGQRRGLTPSTNWLLAKLRTMLNSLRASLKEERPLDNTLEEHIPESR
jgi:hypothetical protein